MSPSPDDDYSRTMTDNEPALLVVTFGSLSLGLVVVGSMIFDGLLATMLMICGVLAGVVALMYLFKGFEESSKEP